MSHQIVTHSSLRCYDLHRYHDDGGGGGDGGIDSCVSVGIVAAGDDD